MIARARRIAKYPEQWPKLIAYSVDEPGKGKPMSEKDVSELRKLTDHYNSTGNRCEIPGPPGTCRGIGPAQHFRIEAQNDDTLGDDVGQAHLFDSVIGNLLRTVDDPTPTTSGAALRQRLGTRPKSGDPQTDSGILGVPSSSIAPYRLLRCLPPSSR